MDINTHTCPNEPICISMNKKMISLKKFAENNDISYKTAHRHWKNGIIEGIQLETGTILVQGWKTGREEEKLKTVESSNRAVIMVRSKKPEMVTDDILYLKKLSLEEDLEVVDVIIWDGYIFQSNPFIKKIIDKKVSHVLTVSEYDIYGINAPVIVELLSSLGIKTISLQGEAKNIPEMIYNSVLASSNMAKAAVGMAGYKRAIAESNAKLLE